MTRRRLAQAGPSSGDATLMKDAIRFKVVVMATVERVEKAGKEWARETAADNSPFSYTPEIEKVVRRDVQVYEQSVDSLDVAALVAVVNGLPKEAS